mmetsp:Transcript_15796/g.42079  ORF Transcript_15796/g.42079 Transcript_15796/m.42079 type:complete len:148 (-) Transcript_15796:159-602(-)
MRPWSLLRRAVVAAAVTTAAASRASGTRHIHADLALGEEQRSSESEVLVTLREGGNPAEWRSVIMKYTSGQEVYSRVDKDGNRVVGFVQQLLASTPDVEELDVGLWGSRPKSDEEQDLMEGATLQEYAEAVAAGRPGWAISANILGD